MNILRNDVWNFIINGSAGSGKDTFINIMANIFEVYDNIKVNNISTIDHIKEAAAFYFGWNGLKDEKGRKLLSDLKDADVKYQNGPFNRVLSMVGILESRRGNNQIINFIHSREPEEIKLFKASLENSHSILIRRDDIKSFSNHADQNVEKCFYNFIFNNNKTINDLEIEILNFINLVLIK